MTVYRTLTALVPSVTPALSSRRHIDLVRVASSGCR
ncbi:putative leader peptide [Streptomyces sp. NPDC056500]